MSTLNQMLLAKLAHADDRPGLHYRDHGSWKNISWREAGERLRQLAGTLVALGLQPGERVAVLGDPHPGWINADFAILGLGGITVGIYPSLTAEQTAYQLAQSGSCIVLVDGPEQQAKVEGIRASLPALRAVLHWEERRGEALSPAAFEQRASKVQPSDIATLVYTSGTTGNPKGAMLTHGALASVAQATQKVMPLQAGESSICFLPLAHVLQRIGVYRALIEDISAYFCQRVEEVMDVLPLAQPSVLLSVPRMLEKIKAGIEGKVREQPARRQRIFGWALGVGRERSIVLEKGEEPGLGLRLRWALAQPVFRQVHARMGGKLRCFATGGAALNPEVARFFHALGIEVLEAWGLTETSAPAAMNRPGNFRFGTVGKPLPGTEVQLAEDGEIKVRGSGLFSGYWQDADATAAVMTTDGWFLTGDIGAWEDGFLKIIDRKKEILVTAGGKNIPPVNIEQKLQGGAIAQAVVIGEGHPYLVALFAPEPGMELPPAEAERLAAERVRAANAQLAPFEQIKKWAWLPEPLTPASGLLTPSLKIRRKPISAHYAEMIEGLYASPR
jgi:long-chain acyl-CoA synthetase